MLEWRSFVANTKLCSRFSADEWHKMVTDIDSDKDWEQFLSEYPQFVKCYILYHVTTNEPIAFAYTFMEDDKGKVVSFHGGGWKRSPYYTLLYYQGMINLVEMLINRGLKVRTACLRDNLVAYRFLKSAGFVNYNSTLDWHYFWINRHRLMSSKIYKRIQRLGLE